MSRRLIFIIFNIVVQGFLCSLKAENRFNYGLEWGLSTQFFAHHSGYFQTEEQYLVKDAFNDRTIHANGFIYLKAGYNLTRHHQIALVSGYTGSGRGYRAFPVLARYSYSIVSNRKGSYLYAEIGPTIDDRNAFRGIGWMGDGGYGYRYRISNELALVFSGSVGYTYSHPDLYDKFSEEKIPERRLRITKAKAANLRFGLALEF